MTTPAGDSGTGTETGQPGANATGAAPPQDPTGNSNGSGTETGTETGPESSPKDWAAEAEKWKTLARKHETRAKENNAAAQKLQAMEDANKTELQRATERAAKAEADRDAEAAERFRLLAAAGNSLGPEFVGFLGAGTQDEINERAVALKTEIDKAVQSQLVEQLKRYGITIDPATGTAPTAAAAASLSLGRRPTESLRPGSAPAAQNGQPTNNNDLLRSMFQRR
jgi:hypothetical protein